MYETQSRPNSLPTSSHPGSWRRRFLEMLPAIQRHASIAFRNLQGDNRDDAIQEVVCNACAAFVRLVDQGRGDAATPSSLAKYAVAQVRDGRRVGCSLNVNDVSSTHCRRRKGVAVQRLNRWDDREECWQEIVVEDKTCTPADIAATRIDYPAFLKSLSPRNRRIAEKLATGESTRTVAEMFGISPGRISQLRQELKTLWERFHEPQIVAATT